MERKNLGVEKLPDKNSKSWRGAITRRIHKMLDGLRECEPKELKKVTKQLGIRMNTEDLKKNNEKLFNKLSKASKKKLVHICLLYTSPSPRDRG